MPITLATPDEFASHHIADGSARVEGYDVTLGWENGAHAYASAFTDKPDYDITILPLSNFLIALDKGYPLIGIPVFIDLFFPQIAVRVNKAAGITSPKDLEGKRVGVRGFGFSPAVWVRGGFADVYGLDLSKVTWVTAEPNSLSGVEISTPAGWTVESGADLAADLESGKLDAVLWDRGGPALTPNTANLFDDPLAEALKYYEQSKFMPLNSMLLARTSVMDENPGLGDAIVDASETARELYLSYAKEDDNYMGLPVKWLREHGMFPYENGVENNRVALETIIRYAHEQGVISRRPDPAELFYAGAL
jgi:4,5-dihydroxyphthalate decarboxylase